MKRIAITWPGFTGYMPDCFRALSRQNAVRVFIEPSALEQRFDGSELRGVDWARVNASPDASGGGTPSTGDIPPRLDVPSALAEIAAFRPDALLVCGWSTPLARAAARMALPCRRIIAFDMPWEWRLRKFAARWLLRPRLRHFDAAFVPGARALRYARWLGFSGRVATGSNPGGWERFSNVSPADTGFLFAGRLAPVKGIQTLLDAYALYRRSTPDPWPFTIVGDGAFQVPPSPGVSALGFVRPDDMPALVARHAVFVLPSLWEPWGIAALEAMSAGLATIATTACGFIDDARPTFTVPPRSHRALADAMRQVHAMSGARRQAEAERARSVARDFSAARWVEHLEALIG